MTKELLIDYYRAELRQASYDNGYDFNLCCDDVEFPANGSVIYKGVELLPPRSIDFKHLEGYLKAKTKDLLIELYGAELRQACDDIGDECDLCGDDVEFPSNGSVIYKGVKLLPPRSIDFKRLEDYF